MLVKYNEANKQTAMGILSTNLNYSSLSLIDMILKKYTKDNHEIYLERKDGTYIGLVLVILQDDFIIVDEMYFIPNNETVFNENEIFRSLQSIFPNRRLIGALKMSAKIERFEMGQVNG